MTRREEEGPSFPPSLSSLPREIFEGKLRVINSELLFRERKRFRNDFSRGGSLRRRRAHRILEQPSLVLLHVFGRGFAYLGTLYRGNKRSRRRRIFDLLLFVSRETRISLFSFGIPYSSSRRNRERERIRAHLSLSKITSSPAEQGREDTFFRADIFTSSEYRYSLSFSPLSRDIISRK